jgi:hypothetical protein
MEAMAAIDFDTEDTSAATMMERRWFIANQRAEPLRSECECLYGVMQAAHASWREAVAGLASMQALCTALSEEFCCSAPEYFDSRK